MTTERSVPPFLHFLPDQRLDGGTVQSLSSRLADLLVRYPAPQGGFHLVVSEGHQVERLPLSVRGLLRMVFDSHRRAREPEVPDNLGGDLLGSVDDACAGVVGKLRADYDGGIPVLLGEVQTNAATGADFGYAPVRVYIIGGQVHQYSSCCRSAPSFRHIAVTMIERGFVRCYYSWSSIRSSALRISGGSAVARRVVRCT
jgi:hypothetical protein